LLNVIRQAIILYEMIHLNSSTNPSVSVVIDMNPDDLRFLKRVAKDEETSLSELLTSSAKLRFLDKYSGPNVQLPPNVAEKLLLPPPPGAPPVSCLKALRKHCVRRRS
jgi:hypothetical protein